MNWLIKGSQAAGILLIAGGLVMCVLHFSIPSFQYSLFPGIILSISGIIIFIVNRFIGNMLQGFPKPPTIKESIQKISSAAEMMKQFNKMNKLSAEGIPVKVKILDFKDTGQIVNYDPVIEFQLEVLKEHRSNNYYINSHRQIVSKILLNRIETGKEFFAKIDPEDRNNILITFS